MAKTIGLCAVKDYLPIDELEFHPENPRRISPDRLKLMKKSIIDKGFYEPILVRKKSNIILSGNHRTKAVRELWDEGYEFVAPDGRTDVLPVVMVDVSDETAEAILFETNNHYAEWVEEQLQQALTAAAQAGRDVQEFGFTQVDIDRLVHEATEEAKTVVAAHERLLPGKKDEEDEDEPEPPVKIQARVKLGEAWVLGRHRLVCGDSSDPAIVALTTEEASAHAIVSDPPYGLSFMGKKWDITVPSVELWRMWWSQLKPGAHVLAFSGTRTYHRMAVAIEDAGFEVRDQMQWLYGQGFPKSTTVGEGLGTALKPANEPICVARKLISEDTVEANVRKHGTGALNVNAARIGTEGGTERGSQAAYPKNADGSEDRSQHWARTGHKIEPLDAGRYPANIALDEKAAAMLDAQTGTPEGASRFFYVAKPSKADRGAGNTHATVKPLRLMEYLVDLVTPPEGIVLDPFAGSGTTLLACEKRGYTCHAVELDPGHCDIILSRWEAMTGEVAKRDKPVVLKQKKKSK